MLMVKKITPPNVINVLLIIYIHKILHLSQENFFKAFVSLNLTEGIIDYIDFELQQ